MKRSVKAEKQEKIVSANEKTKPSMTLMINENYTVPPELMFNNEISKCTTCEMSFELVSELNEHKSKAHTMNEGQYFCNKNFEDTNNQVDYQNIQSETNSLKCNVCFKAFKYKSELCRHYHVHTGEKPYPCNLCEKSYTRKLNLNMHYRTHTGKKTFLCDKKKNQQNIKAEKQEKTSPNEITKLKSQTKCDVYQKEYLANENSTVHTKSTFNKKLYKCPTCEMSFEFISSLNEHKSKAHAMNNGQSLCDSKLKDTINQVEHQSIQSEKNFLDCDVCFKAFKCKSILYKHYRVHSGKIPYVCDICGRFFSQKNSLKIHYRTHTGEKLYVCDICGKLISQKCSLKRHYRVHTGEKPYACNFCGQSFSRKHQLKTHCITHTGEKPFLCTVCNKFFTLKCSLKRHYRVHTGEKPYACNFCGKLFADWSAWCAHRRVHTGEKPFKCSLCEKSFTISGHRLRHTRSVHNKCL